MYETQSYNLGRNAKGSIARQALDKTSALRGLIKINHKIHFLPEGTDGE
jgi:hypothetical protein